MAREQAIKIVQRLIRLHLTTQGYHVEKIGAQWQWRRNEEQAQPAANELAAILFASEALIHASARPTAS